jgi:hypothetical protein
MDSNSSINKVCAEIRQLCNMNNIHEAFMNQYLDNITFTPPSPPLWTAGQPLSFATEFIAFSEWISNGWSSNLGKCEDLVFKA